MASARVGPPVPAASHVVLDDELFVYAPRSGRTLALSGSAGRIWHLADGTRTASDLVDLLEREFPEAAGAVREQVLATLRSFVALGLIEPFEDGAGGT